MKTNKLFGIARLSVTGLSISFEVDVPGFSLKFEVGGW